MPRIPTESSADSADGKRPKRTSACLHCRRQKLRCDGSPDRPCTRCVDDQVECVVRPRANAAILTDDLRWQQSVETRLQGLLRDMEHMRAMNAHMAQELRRRGSFSASVAGISPVAITGSGTVGPPSSSPMPQQQPHPQPVVAQLLPPRLAGLREILRPALAELQRPTPLDVSMEDATLLWDFFYESLAIFHGFTASSDTDTPSPLLFSAVVTASAKRFTGTLSTPVEHWEELFQRALIRLLYITVPKTWDDVVGLGIARTWFWKADEITSGLIYGSFVETTTPNQNDYRNRRVWDFLEMTTVSHGILHLSTPIVPGQPPRGVPDRCTSHVLHMALNELFDALGLVSRALTNPRSLIMLALTSQSSLKEITFAEIVVLRSCRAELERWCPKWLVEIQNVDSVQLPSSSTRGFLADLVTLYYHVALVAIDGYLDQAPDRSGAAQYAASAREVLQLVAGRWAESLHLWPKFFMHSALIAALSLPADDPLVLRVYDLFASRAHTLQTSGAKLLHKLAEHVQNTLGAERLAQPPQTGVSPIVDLDLPIAMAYTASDSFWADLTGMLGLDGPAIQVQQPEWPRDLEWGHAHEHAHTHSRPPQ